MPPSPDSPASVTVACPAKVNLALSVGGPEASGYHPIASWMTALKFADTLTLQRLEPDPQAHRTPESIYTLGFADDAPVPGRIDWPLEKDLAYQAHRALEDAVGRHLPIELTLRKRIPTGAGLGGGSSDAAGVLVGVDRLFGLGLSDTALRRCAAALGSDVPFLVAALQGETFAVASGFGERLRPTPYPGSVDLVLVLPPLSCPTGGVYRAFDELAGAYATVDEARIAGLARCRPSSAADLFNDLADAACRVCPPLAEARRRVAEATGRRVHVTGSGAAMFLLAADRHDARTLADRIAEATGIASIATRALPPHGDSGPSDV